MKSIFKVPKSVPGESQPNGGGKSRKAEEKTSRKAEEKTNSRKAEEKKNSRKAEEKTSSSNQKPKFKAEKSCNKTEQIKEKKISKPAKSLTNEEWDVIFEGVLSFTENQDESDYCNPDIETISHDTEINKKTGAQNNVAFSVEEFVEEIDLWDENAPNPPHAETVKSFNVVIDSIEKESELCELKPVQMPDLATSCSKKKVTGENIDDLKIKSSQGGYDENDFLKPNVMNKIFQENIDRSSSEESDNNDSSDTENSDTEIEENVTKKTKSFDSKNIKHAATQNITSSNDELKASKKTFLEKKKKKSFLVDSKISEKKGTNPKKSDEGLLEQKKKKSQQMEKNNSEKNLLLKDTDLKRNNNGLSKQKKRKSDQGQKSTSKSELYSSEDQEGTNPKKSDEGLLEQRKKKNQMEKKVSEKNFLLKDKDPKRNNNGLSKQKKRKTDKRQKSKSQSEVYSSDDEPGTWVQCDNLWCKKWRHVHEIEDPALFPDKWFCHMNSDKHYNSCKVGEETFDDTDHIYTKFTPGSIVWAKMDGYPWWPAMVETDHDYKTYFELRTETSMYPTQYHVSFLDEDVSRAWMITASLWPYDPYNQPRNPTLPKHQQYEKELEIAKQNANEALKLSVQERLKKYGFPVRYSHKKKANRKFEFDEMDILLDEEKKFAKMKKKHKKKDGKPKPSIVLPMTKKRQKLDPEVFTMEASADLNAMLSEDEPLDSESEEELEDDEVEKANNKKQKRNKRSNKARGLDETIAINVNETGTELIKTEELISQHEENFIENEESTENITNEANASDDGILPPMMKNRQKFDSEVFTMDASADLNERMSEDEPLDSDSEEELDDNVGGLLEKEKDRNKNRNESSNQVGGVEESFLINISETGTELIKIEEFRPQPEVNLIENEESTENGINETNASDNRIVTSKKCKKPKYDCEKNPSNDNDDLEIHEIEDKKSDRSAESKHKLKSKCDKEASSNRRRLKKEDKTSSNLKELSDISKDTSNKNDKEQSKCKNIPNSGIKQNKPKSKITEPAATDKDISNRHFSDKKSLEDDKCTSSKDQTHKIEIFRKKNKLKEKSLVSDKKQEPASENETDEENLEFSENILQVTISNDVSSENSTKKKKKKDISKTNTENILPPTDIESNYKKISDDHLSKTSTQKKNKEVSSCGLSDTENIGPPTDNRYKDKKKKSKLSISKSPQAEADSVVPNVPRGDIESKAVKKGKYAKAVKPVTQQDQNVPDLIATIPELDTEEETLILKDIKLKNINVKDEESDPESECLNLDEKPALNDANSDSDSDSLDLEVTGNNSEVKVENNSKVRRFAGHCDERGSDSDPFDAIED